MNHGLQCADTSISLKLGSNSVHVPLRIPSSNGNSTCGHTCGIRHSSRPNISQRSRSVGATSALLYNVRTFQVPLGKTNRTWATATRHLTQGPRFLCIKCMSHGYCHAYRMLTFHWPATYLFHTNNATLVLTELSHIIPPSLQLSFHGPGNIGVGCVGREVGPMEVPWWRGMSRADVAVVCFSTGNPGSMSRIPQLGYAVTRMYPSRLMVSYLSSPSIPSSIYITYKLRSLTCLDKADASWLETFFFARRFIG